MFQIEAHIATPPDAVFAALARVSDAPLWYSAVESVEPLDKLSPGRGSQYRFQRRIGGSVVHNIVEITEFEPEQALTITSLSGPTPFTYRYTLRPSEAGTQLHLAGEIAGDGLGGAMSLFKPVAETFFKRGMAANLNTLKQLIEGARPSAWQ